MTSPPRPRRPLTPTSLRDVDLSHLQPPSSPSSPSHPHAPALGPPHLAHPSHYPAPPTGHDLMAMFPPPPPDAFPDLRLPTSGFFQRQERAFFAQAGREIVRVRVEVDFPAAEEGTKRRPGLAPVLYPRPVRGAPGVAPPQTPLYPTTPGGGLALHPLHNPQQPPSGPGTGLHTPPPPVHLTSVPAHMSPPPHPSLSHPSPLSHSAHPSLSHPSPLAHSAHPAQQQQQHQPEEYDNDESWRRPMPYAERRRAGKHTKRVIVRT